MNRLTRAWVAVLIAGPLALLLVPSGAFRPEVEPTRSRPAVRAEGAASRSKARAREPGIGAYADLASWVDIYDEGPWRHPARTVRKLADRGAKTLLLQTANYGAKRAIFDKSATSTFIETAHREGMKVVAWYVPDFAHMDRDFRRTMRAIRFRSRKGHRFDSFAMDIEATVVGDIETRNDRLKALARRTRAAVGPDYPLGAIIPDPEGSTYWPRFPFKEVARRFDVILPMGYFTYRTSGPRSVYRYTRANIRIIRKRTGDPDVPIHVIGGIASSAEPKEVKGFVRAVKRHRAFGASLYDYPITGRKKWAKMRPVRTLPAAPGR